MLDAPGEGSAAENLLAAGFPFCREAVTVRGEIELPPGAVCLRFMEMHADCARVFIDGVDCGWCWGADWSVELSGGISAGRQTLEVRLVPSTFNHFGPHHHVDGDPPVVSPVQFQYVKNFADRPDALVNTRVGAWHFKPFGIGARLVLATDKTGECCR